MHNLFKATFLEWIIKKPKNILTHSKALLSAAVAVSKYKELDKDSKINFQLRWSLKVDSLFKLIQNYSRNLSNIKYYLTHRSPKTLL